MIKSIKKMYSKADHRNKRIIENHEKGLFPIFKPQNYKDEGI